MGGEGGGGAAAVRASLPPPPHRSKRKTQPSKECELSKLSEKEKLTPRPPVPPGLASALGLTKGRLSLKAP